MRNKKLKRGFISVLSACLVLSSSFNAYALSQEVETQGVKYTLELEGVTEAGEELTATFAPSDKVGGMQTVIYTWFIDGEQVYFDWGIEKESSVYTINQGEAGEVYVIVDFGDLNNVNQQLKSNSLMIEKIEGSEGGDTGEGEKEEVTYSLELTGTPSAGETLTGLFSPYEQIKGDIYYYWWLNGNVVNTDGLSEETTYTVQEEDEGKIYIEAQFENNNSEYMTIKSNTLTIEKSNTEEGGETGNTGEGGTEEGGSTEKPGEGEENGEHGAGDTGNTGNTDTGAGDTDDKGDTGDTGNENTDNKDEAGDTDDKGDNETSGEGGTGNTDDKGNTDEDGSLDDSVNISTPSDAEKEENTGNNGNTESGKDEEDKTDNNNNSNSSNSSNSNNSNSHSSSSHSSSRSTSSEVYKWEFVNYKNQNYKLQNLDTEEAIQAAYVLSLCLNLG